MFHAYIPGARSEIHAIVVPRQGKKKNRFRTRLIETGKTRLPTDGVIRIFDVQTEADETFSSVLNEISESEEIRMEMKTKLSPWKRDEEVNT